MSAVSKTNERSWERDIELIFNNTGMRPGEVYQVVVEAKGCNDSKVKTGAITIETYETIKPQIEVEKELFQDKVGKLI